MGQREIVETAFGCPMLLHYGHSEMCCVASWCLEENHYHLEELYGYTELLDAAQKVIIEPGQMGEITATGLNNYVLPLIRYRTADYAAYAEHITLGEFCRMWKVVGYRRCLLHRREIKSR